MNKTEIATVGGGCFWCIEAVYQRIDGIKSVTPGYAGGKSKTTTYKEVCTGTTGHAEVAKIEFDTNVITYEQILNVFWQAHDPTTLNRQGNDIGTHYRSAVFYHNENQRLIAEEYKQQLDQSGVFKNSIVTEITEWQNFYPAENYHSDYFDLNGEEPYCRFVIRPKVEKFEKTYAEKLRKK